MLYVILPVHNRAAVTLCFVAQLCVQTVQDFTLVLVDDGCTDDTVARAGAEIPASRLVVLKGDGNLWWAGALQLAWDALAQCDLGAGDAVLILNDDVSIGPDFLASGLALLRERPDAAWQAVARDPDGGQVDHGTVADLLHLEFRGAAEGEKPNCLSTRGLIMSGVTFAQSGGLRPRWLPHYLSDYEFTLRLARQGVPLAVDERFHLVFHPESSGIDRQRFDGVGAYWSAAFSNRAKFNAARLSAFALMACPWWTLPWHLARIWARFGAGLIASALPR